MIAVVVGRTGIVKAQIGLHLTALVATEGGSRGRVVAARVAGGRERLGKQGRSTRGVDTRISLSLTAKAVGALDDLVFLSVGDKGKRRRRVPGEQQHTGLAEVQGGGATLAVGGVVLEGSTVGVGRTLAWLDDDMTGAVATASTDSAI